MENKFEGVDTWDLIKELQTRGYNTELVFSIHDVDRHLENINEDREDGEKFELDEMDKENILESLSYDWHCERINEDLFDKIWNYVNEGT